MRYKIYFSDGARGPR